MTASIAPPASRDPSVAGTTAASIVRQRLVIVLPSTGEFDSRTYRIATGVAARGHDVTVLARAAAGVPDVEAHPAGYRIVRVPVDPVAALPLPAIWRRLRSLRRSRRPGQGPTDGAAEPHRSGRRRVATLRAAGRAGWRIAAIGLTVRAQVLAARQVAPVADLYHGMAYMGIPVALALAARSGAPVVYDARDIYLEARNLARLPPPARSLVGRIERRWAHRSSRVATVNRPYAEVLAERLHVPLPLIVMNCSLRYERSSPPVRRFHERLGLAGDRLIVLYHGGLFPERGIEQLIEAIVDVPRADLVLMGYGVLEDRIPAWIAASPARARIHLLPAVPPESLHDWVAAADVVAMPIQPTTLNHRLTTPNKLFEAMAAGVPVVAADLPGMAAIVTETDCGVLCDPTSPRAIASAINAIVEGPDDVRRAMGDRAARAADEVYNWESQQEILLAEYTRLTGRPW